MLEIKNLCFSAQDGAEKIDILKNIDLNNLLLKQKKLDLS